MFEKNDPKLGASQTKKRSFVKPRFTNEKLVERKSHLFNFFNSPKDFDNI